ncbi:MAG TPA: YbgF trimerization domain-containing protein, partial [Hyphomicrobiales bacterium]|nr:YbgF trimerization domain-containing protein [Hyphomicrobiales bacterium]
MRTTVSALLLLWVATASAQPAGGEAGNELVVNLYNQLQELQSEVQTLRGLVEEQGYQLQRLQTESRDRYIDIDRRLSEVTLSGGAQQPFSPGGTAPPQSAPGAAGNPPFGAPPASAGDADFLGTADALPPGSRNPPAPAGSNNGGAGTAAGASGGGAQPLILDEEEQYRYALNMLLEENKYVQAIDGFQSYIDRFPNGRRLTNALYW